jgi:uroporphyrinogen III methyltransferase/synthase
MSPARVPRVLVPCAEDRAELLSSLLRMRGAAPVELPFSRTLPPPDLEALRAAARHIGAYDLAAFSSVHAVERFLAQVPDPTAFQALEVAAVGSRTAEALRQRGVPVSIVPSVFTGEGLLDALFANPARAAAGRALFVRAREGREVVPAGLRAAGWQVDEVSAYRTEYTPAEVRAPLRSMLERRELEVILLTASGVARTLVQAIGEDGLGWLQGVDLVSIGPVTTETARTLGLHVKATASPATFAGLVKTLVETRCP